MSAPPTAVLGGCALEALVGMGRSGRVYRARHLMLGRLQAVKLLHHRGESQRQALVRLRQEAITAALSHPHLLTLYDAGETEGLRYLVMEWAAGGSLRDLLRRSGPLGLAPMLSLDLVRQAALGLAAAHRHGLLHRDLKPENLLLVETSTPAQPFGYTLKLGDFGLVRPDGAVTHGAGEGTPAYLAPEQRHGQVTDARSDIYALGVVLYESLTGRLPPNDSPEALVDRLRLAPALRLLRPDRSHAVTTLLARCLASDPARRIASAAKLAHALEELLR